MFRMVRLLCRRPHLQAVVHEHGHTVHPAEVGRQVTEYFEQQFRDDVAIGLPAFKGDNQPLKQPIEASEVNSAMVLGIRKLNNARACEYDSLPSELLKYAADQLDAPLPALFNQSLEHGQPLELGRGILILLQKPGKPIGALSSLMRPIVLLTTLRKVLSMVTICWYWHKFPARSIPIFQQDRVASGMAEALLLLCLITTGWQLSLKNIRRPWRYWE